MAQPVRMVDFESNLPGSNPGRNVCSKIGGLDCLDHSPAWPFMSRRVCSSVVERVIADPAVAGSNPVAPFKGKNIFSPR